MEQKDKKGESLAINKLIVVILIVLVLALFFFFWFRQDIWNYIRNLPGYNSTTTDKEIDYTKMTPDQLVQFDCKEVGGILSISSPTSSTQYLRIGTKKTNLYFDRANILIDFGTLNSFENKIGFGNVILVGSLDENDVIKIDPTFLNENSQDYIRYQNLLPSIVELRVIDGAFKLGTNLFCKKNQQIQDLRLEANCIDSCNIHNGVCKTSKGEGEISLGKINCASNEECFVKISEEKIEDDKLLLNDFSSAYINSNINPPKLMFLGKNSVEVEIGERQIVSFSAYYPKTRTESASGKSFCYVVRSNDRVLKTGYNQNGGNNGEATTAFATFNNNEKTFEVVIWDPSVNPVQKVLKRIETSSKSNLDFNGLTMLLNNKFKEEVLKKSEGKFYVVDAPYRFADGKVISTYRIDKYSDKIEIYGYYLAGKDKKSNWYAVDCYTGFFGFISIGINLDKIEPSLVGTLTKNNCKLKY